MLLISFSLFNFIYNSNLTLYIVFIDSEYIVVWLFLCKEKIWK